MAQLTEENLEKMEDRLWDVLEQGDCPSILNVLLRHRACPPSNKEVRTNEYVRNCVSKDEPVSMRGFVDAVYLKADGVYRICDEAEDDDDEDDESEYADDIEEADYDTFIRRCHAFGDGLLF